MFRKSGRVVHGAQRDEDWRKAFLYEYNYEMQFPYTPNIRGVRIKTALLDPKIRYRPQSSPHARREELTVEPTPALTSRGA
jgi:hypothetical protein